MNDPDPRLVRELLIGTLTSLAISTVILVGLIVLMFYLGGFFRILGWFFAVVLIIWDWRTLRQVFKLLRGDMSL